MENCSSGSQRESSGHQAKLANGLQTGGDLLSEHRLCLCNRLVYVVLCLCIVGLLQHKRHGHAINVSNPNSSVWRWAQVSAF